MIYIENRAILAISIKRYLPLKSQNVIIQNMSILVFPGQGSQSRSFIAALKYDSVKNVLNQAQGILGYSVIDLADEQRQTTMYSQVDIFVKSIALLELYKDKPELFMSKDKINPTNHNIDFVAGHSLGQYSACVASRVFDFETGLNLVRKRGELMELCSTKIPGSMVACIGHNVTKIVTDIISEIEGVFLANYNSKAQVVISGELKSVESAVEECKLHGIRCIKLNVAGGFHTPLMTSANIEMNTLLSSIKFNDPKAGFITNKTKGIVMKGEKVQADMIDQIISPVRWVDIVEEIESIAENSYPVYEIGPGNVLSKLIDAELGIQVISLEDLADKDT
jgi:[acyl-carrier-protein] S-malonyltransferase